MLRYTVIIYKFTQGNLGARSRFQSSIKKKNCDIGDRQRDPWTVIDTNVVGLNRLMESQLFSLHNWISNNNTDINKQQQKTAQLKHSNIFFENVNVQNLIQEIDKGCSRIRCVKTYIFHPHHPPIKKNVCNLKTTTHKIQMLNLLFSLVTNSASSFCGTLEYILLSI